ncbi:MAG TPA: M90 family metallopeptidase [Pseudomonadales bacterium]
MLNWLQQRRQRHILKHHAIARPIWRELMQAALFQRLDHQQQQQLHRLASLFLHHKTLSATGGMQLDDFSAAAIAAQACLPVLQLGLDWYNGWVEVIIYPDDFVAEHEHIDEAGVVSRVQQPLGGEAWLRGPVILSARSLMDDLAIKQPGHNLVIHEFAHKLDMQNGAANGMPPLHRQMRISDWTDSFTAAFNHLQQQLAQGETSPVDPYAASEPAEFFAVCSENFFSNPRQLHDSWPAVYHQLTLFYRQQPLINWPQRLP